MQQAIDSIVNCDEIKKAECVILTASYDRTSSLGGGANRGGLEIVKCLREDIEFLDKHLLVEPGYMLKIAHKNLGISNDLLPEEMVEKLETEYSELMINKQFLMLLGGDHSVSIGALRAIAKYKDPKNITILQIDAHFDLRNDDANANPDQSHVSKYAHACVMRRAFELGFNIVQVGIRSYAKEEYEFAKKNNVTVFEWGMNIPSIQDIIDSIKTDQVYITLDVDGIDPAHMPATGTPVPGGLEWYYSVDLLLKTIQDKFVIGADIVEVIPKEGEYLTQFAAAQLCYEMIGHVLLKK